MLIKYLVTFFTIILIASLLILCQPKAVAEERPVVEDVVIQNHLPVNNDWPTKEEIKTYIREEAIKHNINVETALRIANCESGYNRLAKNNTSSATGIYQFINVTWAANCQGNRLNPYHNIDCYMDYYPKHPGAWECK